MALAVLVNVQYAISNESLRFPKGTAATTVGRKLRVADAVEYEER